MSEKELSDLLEQVRSLAESANSEFRYLPQCGIAAEAVCLRACAAQFHKSRVSFCRQCDPATSVSDAPLIVVWRLQSRAKGDQVVWSVDRFDEEELTAKELAQRILKQLGDYCKSYEESIGSFGAPGLDYVTSEA